MIYSKASIKQFMLRELYSNYKQRFLNFQNFQPKLNEDIGRTLLISALKAKRCFSRSISDENKMNKAEVVKKPVEDLRRT